MQKLFTTLLLLISAIVVNAQSTNDILNVLIANQAITQEQADSLRAEAAIKQQDDAAKQKSFGVTAGRKLQLAGYAHFRYQQFDETGKYDGFDIRRAYLDAKATISPYWNYRLQVDFATSPKIVDAYTELKLNDHFNFILGQQVLPFSLENITSNTKGDLIDRSQVVEALVSRVKDLIGNHNGRDIGLTTGGKFFKHNSRYLFDYRIGVFNGQGVNTTDKNKTQDVSARLVATPIEGLGIGGSFYQGRGNYTPKGATNLVSFDRNRWGAELSYDYKNFSLRGEFITGEDGDVKREGYYAQAGYYVLPKTLQAVVKYDVYDTDTNVDDNLSTNYVVGLNYTFNAWVRLQLAYTVREEEGTSVINNFGAAQLQVAF